MDDWLNEYAVEVKQADLIKLKQLARVEMEKRVDRYETSMVRILIELICKELRFYALNAILMTILMCMMIPYTTEPYMIVAFHSGLLGSMTMIEVFRMFRYRMNELQFPTKLGMGRLFLYKMIAVSLLEFTLIFLLMIIMKQSVSLNGTYLLLYGIIPNVFVCTCLLYTSMYFHSLLSMVISYGFLLLLTMMLCEVLIDYVSIQLLQIIVPVVTICMSLFLIVMMLLVYKRMKEKGGEQLWN